MNIRKNILIHIKKEISLKDRIIFYLFRRYTLKIYKIGFDDGFNYNIREGCKKAEKNKNTNIDNNNKKL